MLLRRNNKRSQLQPTIFSKSSSWSRSFIRTIMALALTLLFIASITLVLPDTVQSQPPPPPTKPEQTPIDGGLGLLAAAGGAYAIKKLRDSKKE